MHPSPHIGTIKSGLYTFNIWQCPENITRWKAVWQQFLLTLTPEDDLIKPQSQKYRPTLEKKLYIFKFLCWEAIEIDSYLMCVGLFLNRLSLGLQLKYIMLSYSF